MSENYLPEIEIDLKTLPTRGVGYPDGTVIKYRTYTFGEVKKSSISSKGVTSAMKLALSCLTVTGMDKMSLSVMDMFYIGLLMKSSSLGGEKFILPFICPHCGEHGEITLTQSDITFVDMDERIKSLPIEAEINGKRLKFGPMTVKQFIDLYEGAYNGILKDGKPDAVSALAMLNKSMSFKESYDFLYSLTSVEDAETMDAIDKALMHNLEPIKTVCKNEDCKADILVKMEGKEALLQPFREGERPNRPRIFFEQGTSHQSATPLSDGIHDGNTVEQKAN